MERVDDDHSDDGGDGEALLAESGIDSWGLNSEMVAEFIKVLANTPTTTEIAK